MVTARRPLVGPLLAAVVAALALAVGLGGPAHAAAPDLVGTFRIDPGRCSPGATGSYFRMILPTGDVGGPFIENADATCGDKTYTLLSPGSDGGLVTGTDQSAPSPGFDAKGNSLAARVIRPVAFFGVQFSASTNAKDLQTGASTKVPALRAEGGRLTGDLSAFAATWNKQSFNQGAPKPDGSTPGNTAAPTGTYDAATGRYSLTWRSQIVGGPFDKFTGLWHLEGTFTPASGGTAAPAASGSAPRATVAANPGSSPAAAPSGGTTGTTALDGTASPTGVAAPSASVVPSAAAATREQRAERAALAAAVHDDGFRAPTWAVVVLALLGIGGVVALLLLGPNGRPDGAGG